MKTKIQLLDCTLRDGAYVVDGKFDTPVIKGIIKKLQQANIDIIECGWLKNNSHIEGTTFYHFPTDIEQYLPVKSDRSTYVAMIDWDRYDLDRLPLYNKKSIDAIRVVFPREHFPEGIALGEKIKGKGYQVYFQAANTLGYSDGELLRLAEAINMAQPAALSVVDTFGAMYSEELMHIIDVLDSNLDKNIRLGFHSHNNQQLSFSLSMQFADWLVKRERNIIIDSSLCGMGRGAGNATTELVAQFLNRKYNGNYDMNIIMDTIDIYMRYFKEYYKWGYSTPFFIAGMFCTHVNNVEYLLENHRTNARDMRNIIESLSPEERIHYDYDLLEEKFFDYQNKVVNDEAVLEELSDIFKGKTVLLLLSGKSVINKIEQITNAIQKEKPIIIGVNAIIDGYDYDWLFFSQSGRKEYASVVYKDKYESVPRILTSNITIEAEEKEKIVNYNLLVKRGWQHFDNSGIMCLRLMNKLHVKRVLLAGFDGFEETYEESYADIFMPHINPGMRWSELNDEIKDMLGDFIATTSPEMDIEFITESKYM